MSSILIKNGKTLSGEEYDIFIKGRSINQVTEPGAVEGDAELEYDADGNLVTPTFSEPHCHLDLSQTAGKPGWNEDGSLLSGIKLWNEYKQDISKSEVKERARKTIKWFVANGVTRIRTHVDVSETELICAEAILELKEELEETIEIQVVAFPQAGILTNLDNHDRMEEVVKMGADHVGAIPHFEYTNEDGVESVKMAMDMAEEYDVGADLHIDEIDDPGSRFTEVLASETLKREFSGPATASHSTALHSYPNAYANKLISYLAEAGVNVITNPLDNSVLQGAHDDYPRRRGHTRVDELHEAGVTVGLGHDSVMDVVYEYGMADPLDAAYVLAHYAHMNGHDDVDTLWEMLTDANARVFGKSSDEYGLSVGNEGSVIVHNATNPHEAIRTRSKRQLVVSRGEVVSEATPTEPTVSLFDTETQVDFT
jgi:cytosine deaminase